MKKGLRQAVREMAVGQTMSVERTDYAPSVVRTTVYTLHSDYDDARYSVCVRKKEPTKVTRIS